ncbi:hypothetical protein O4L62_004772 [Salmonella enterica subsp. enterica serovar Infantis]|nr:hypothetical protein [Salmonella enterica subsp. enterica serovar Infantis]EKH1603428.1 hypothetical protein [Salmonella enterica subsp. enterica serovar Infantis]
MSDVTAFNNCINVFWRQHEAELSRFLTSKTGDSEKAADLLQELFLRARAHSDSFCEMENPRAWLYRAARNLLIDGYRTTREFVELEEDTPLTDASSDVISTLDICLPETLRHCCKVSDEAAFCLIQRPYISKTLLTRRISPRGSP